MGTQHLVAFFFHQRVAVPHAISCDSLVHSPCDFMPNHQRLRAESCIDKFPFQFVHEPPEVTCRVDPLLYRPNSSPASLSFSRRGLGGGSRTTDKSSAVAGFGPR